MFVPREYQKNCINHIIEHKRCCVFAGMGMGKTASTLFAISALKAVGEVKKVLVLAPLRVAASTWPDEVQKWSADLNLTISPITGTPAQREAALKRNCDIYTINYEGLPWFTERVLNQWPFDMIVADESTRLKSFRLKGGSKRAKMLYKCACKCKRFVNLTGTPAPNGLIDLWGQMFFIDRGERLEKTFTAFTGKYFDQKRVGSSVFAVKYIPCDFAPRKINERLKDVCISVQPEDYFNIDQPIINDVIVHLPPEAQRIYTELERDMFTELQDGEEIDAVNAAALTMKCLQVASGALYTSPDNKAYRVVHDEKISALESIIEEAAGAPILVAYQFVSDAKRILASIKGARLMDKDPQTLRDWNAGKIPVLLAHPASAGHGLNMQDGGNILVNFSHGWNLEHYLQIIERIGPVRQAQSGHPRPVFIYNIIAEGTLDRTVIARRSSKKEVQDVLLEELKRRKEAGIEI